MEIFANLIWVAVTLSLWTCWLSCRRSAGRNPGAPSLALQLVALGMLAVVLLPVISVTDDLQATHNPAEVEHFSRRCDLLQPSPDQPLRSDLQSLARLLALLAPPRLQTSSLLASDEPIPPALRGHVLAAVTRPPPAA